MMRAVYVVAMLCGSAMGGNASEIALTCTFVTECLSGEGCNETAYSVSLDGETGEPTAIMDGNVTMTSDAETVAMSGMEMDDVLILVSGDPSMHRVLTHTPDGALLTVHISDGPLAITYAGTCE